MQTVEKQTGVIDERLYSEEFRQNLLKSPVLKEKRNKGKELIRKLQKKSSQQ